MTELTEKQKNAIEKTGVAYEKRGMQPTIGRMIGLFLVNESPEIPFDEIQSKLGISKSGTSQALHFLEARNLVEYITKPGERKRYFKLKTGDWRADFSDKFIREIEFSSVLGEIIEARPSHTKEFNDDLREVKLLLEYLHEEIPKLIRDFFEKNKRNKS